VIVIGASARRMLSAEGWLTSTTPSLLVFVQICELSQNLCIRAHCLGKIRKPAPVCAHQQQPPTATHLMLCVQYE